MSFSMSEEEALPSTSKMSIQVGRFRETQAETLKYTGIKESMKRKTDQKGGFFVKKKTPRFKVTALATVVVVYRDPVVLESLVEINLS